MRVIWTPEAEQDRADIWDFIAADNPHAAARMDELFSDAAAAAAPAGVAYNETATLTPWTLCMPI